MIIDSHCHLESNKYKIGLEEIVKKANQVGVKYMLSICTDNESFEKILKILKNFNNIYGTYGIHPHEADKYKSITSDDINKKVEIRKIIAIGESGLDFYYNHSDKESQKSCFLKHIRSSQETNKTLIVHSRNAEREMYDIILNEKKNKEFKVLMHCFTGSKDLAHKLLDLDCYFSSSGIITFKKNFDLSETFKSIPNEKILVETDSPYLSPEPLRGQINEPSHIIHTIKFLAKIKNLDEKKVEEFTSNNFIKLFDFKI
tara:strand:- start:351 stop:1124 length:774 start_codon:yes stop_codon:yes gene_type:complete